MYKKVIFCLLGLFTALAISSCSDNQSSTMKHPADTLRIDVGAEPPTLDYQLQLDTVSARIAYDFAAGLLDFDQQNNPIPGMAEKWDIAKDGKTITFYLRPHLQFSDGSPITARDFVYSWQRLIDPKTAAAYNYLLEYIVNGRAIINGKMAPTSLGVEAPDDTTFVVHFEHPDNAFLEKCTMPNLGVVSQKNIQQYGQRWTDPDKMVSSGAYRLKEHVVNGYILAEKNPHYYDADKVKIPFVKYFPYEDTSASLASYESGGLDMTFQTVPVDRYPSLKKKYPTQLHTVSQEALYYFDFNMKLPALHNVKLRQALSMAIDRTVLTRDVLRADQRPSYSVVTETIENGQYPDIRYDWSDWPRDKRIAKAKKLYAEAGYGPNNPLKLSISFNTNDGHQKVALAMASMWKDVLGVETTVQNQEWKTFIDARKSGNYMIARDGWVADYNSVTTYLILYECGNLQNNSHYCNTEYNRLTTLGNSTLDPLHQKNYYHQALQIALDDYATIPLYQYTYQRLIKPYVANDDVAHNYLDHTQSKWISFNDNAKVSD